MSDKFWDADIERAKHPPKPSNVWDAIRTIAKVIGVVAIIYIWRKYG